MPHPPARPAQAEAAPPWWAFDLGSWLTRCCAIERAGASVVHGRSADGASFSGANKFSGGSGGGHRPILAVAVHAEASLGLPASGGLSGRSEDGGGPGAGLQRHPRAASPGPLLSRTSSWCEAPEAGNTASEAITAGGSAWGGKMSKIDSSRAYSWSPNSTPRVDATPLSKALPTFSRGVSPAPGPSSRAGSRPPRAPSPASSRMSARPSTLNDIAAFWASAVISKVALDASDGQGMWTRMELRDLLAAVWTCPLVSYTELRYAFRTNRLVPLPPPLGMQHSFVCVELGRVKGAFADVDLSLERFDNRLELMLGERSAMRALRHHRATGELRGIDAEKPLEVQQTVPLGEPAGLPVVKVSDLFAWLTGPLAMAWQPYDLARMQCQHFTLDLTRFLRGEEHEIKVHSLHPRLPPGRLSVSSNASGASG